MEMVHHHYRHQYTFDVSSHFICFFRNIFYRYELSAPVSLLDMVRNSGAQPDLLSRPKPKNSKFGPDSPREGVKVGPPSVPDHILHEKQVLRFFGVFSEERPWDSDAVLGVPQMESTITRHLSICFFFDQ